MTAEPALVRRADAGQAARGLARAAEAMLARHRWAAIVSLLVLLSSAAIVLARQKALWTDEIFTYHFAHLPSLGALWAELEESGDPIPPFFYAVTRAFVAAFGEGEIALRLPEVAGFALTGLFLFVFVARRTSALYGLLAILALVASDEVFAYAFEARPYALVLGLSAASLLGWQLAAEGGSHRKLGLTCLGVSVAGAVAFHHYAILLLFPLAVGEAVRSLGARRVDPWPWVAFAAGFVPLLVSLPLIRAARDHASAFWAHPYWRGAVDFYAALLGPAQAALFALVILVGLAAVIRRRSVGRARAANLPAPAHELVALGVLLLLPLLAVAIGKLETNAYTHRYALPAVVGVAALFALAVYRLDGAAPVLGTVLLAALVVWSAGRVVDDYRSFTGKAEAQRETIRFLREAGEPGLPIAVASPLDYLELAHESSTAEGPRLTYLASPETAVRRLNTDSADRGRLVLAQLAPLDVRRFEQFSLARRRFLVYEGGGPWAWLVAELRETGWTLTERARHEHGVLFEATAPD